MNVSSEVWKTAFEKCLRLLKDYKDKELSVGITGRKKWRMFTNNDLYAKFHCR
jgi:hypothetical protein